MSIQRYHFRTSRNRCTKGLNYNGSLVSLLYFHLFYTAHQIRPLPIDQRNHGFGEERRAISRQGGPYFEFVWTEATHPNSIYATYQNTGTQSGNNSFRKSTSGSGIAFRQTQGVQTWRSKHRILSQLQKLLAQNKIFLVFWSRKFFFK